MQFLSAVCICQIVLQTQNVLVQTQAFFVQTQNVLVQTQAFFVQTQNVLVQTQAFFVQTQTFFLQNTKCFWHCFYVPKRIANQHLVSQRGWSLGYRKPLSHSIWRRLALQSER